MKVFLLNCPLLMKVCLSSLGLIMIAPSITLAMQLNHDSEVNKTQISENDPSLSLISSSSLNLLEMTESSTIYPEKLSFINSQVQYDVVAEFNKNWQEQSLLSQSDSLAYFNHHHPEISSQDHEIAEIPEPNLLLGLEILGLGIVGIALRKLKF